MAIRDFLVLAISIFFVIQNCHVVNTTTTTQRPTTTTQCTTTTTTQRPTTTTTQRPTTTTTQRPTTTTTQRPTTTTKRPTTTKKGWDWNKNYEYENDKYYPNKDYNSYGRGGGSYRDDDKDYNSYGRDGGSYRDDDKDYSSSQYRPTRQRSPDSSGYLNIYMRDSYKGGKSKRYKPLRFPVARYERRRFPLLGPFVNFMPWIPIFADRMTKQTIIYSPSGGVFILPPVINFFGKLISVAELIASGYASLVSTGIPPPPALDVAPLVHPTPLIGPGVPTFDAAKSSFDGPVRSNVQAYPAPKYPSSIRTNY